MNRISNMYHITSWHKAHPVVEETHVVDGGASWDYFIDIGDKSEVEKGKKKTVEAVEDPSANDNLDPAEKEKLVRAGIAELHEIENKYKTGGKVTHEEAEKVVAEVKQKHPVFTSIRVDSKGAIWQYFYTASPENSEDGSAIDRPILNTPSVLSYANPAKSNPLTAQRKGNSRTVDFPEWAHAFQLNSAFGPDKDGVYGRKGPWVKGHKIHHELGGDGTNPSNLFIIDRKANDFMISKVESVVIGKLNELISLDDVNNPDYNKVMYYEVAYDYHGSAYPLGGFANNIIMSYGTMDADGSNPDQIDSLPTTSSIPSLSTTQITLDLNGLGEKNIYNFLGKKGIHSGYSRYLALILGKQKYTTMDDLLDKLTDDDNFNKYNEKPPGISLKELSAQNLVLTSLIRNDLTFDYP